MPRQMSVAISLFIAVAVASAAVGPAMAGGGNSVSLRHVLRLAVLSTLEQRSAHVRGAVSLAESTGKGVSTFSVSLGATFHGDIRVRNTPALQLKGQFRAITQARNFKIKYANRVAAAKIGKQPWQCLPVSVPTPGSVTPGAAMGLLKLHRWLRHLAQQVRLVNLGSGVFNGVPVWDIQARLHTRLNLSTLLAATPASVAVGFAGVAQRHELRRLITLPHPWLNVKANLWVSQLNYSLQRVAVSARLRLKQATVGLKFWIDVTRYGEMVPIKAPPACSAANSGYSR